MLSGERMLVLVAARDPQVDQPTPDQLYDVGVAGIVARMLKIPDGTIRILVQGTERVRVSDYVTEEPYLVARIEPLPDVLEPYAGARGPVSQRAAYRSPRSSSRSRTCPRSSSSRSPTSTIPPRSPT